MEQSTGIQPVLPSGGIYVNGANNYYGANGANGELYLKNAIITDNQAEYDGAGLATCPISKTKMFVNNGVAIYNNTANRYGKELYLLSSDYYGLHAGRAEYKVSR